MKKLIIYQTKSFELMDGLPGAYPECHKLCVFFLPSPNRGAISRYFFYRRIKIKRKSFHVDDKFNWKFNQFPVPLLVV